jgi:hypothetical protein
VTATAPRCLDRPGCILVIAAALATTGCPARRMFHPTTPKTADDNAVAVAADRVWVRDDLMFGERMDVVMVRLATDAQTPTHIATARLAGGASAPCQSGVATTRAAVELRGRQELWYEFTKSASLAEGAFRTAPTYLDLELRDAAAVDRCVRIELVGDAGVQWRQSTRWFVGAGARVVGHLDRSGSDLEPGWRASVRAGRWIGAMKLALEPIGIERVAGVTGVPIAAALEVPLAARDRWFVTAAPGYEVAYWFADAAADQVLHGPRLALRIGRVPERLRWPAFRYRVDAEQYAVEVFGAASFHGADRAAWTIGAGVVADWGF